MKKKIIIIIAIIVAIFIGIVTYFVINDLNQENKLRDEISYLDELINSENIDIDKINEVLDRNVTKDDYQKVENAYKLYLSESFNVVLTITNILEDEKLTNILTVSNYEKDGPDFVVSKEYLETTKEVLGDSKTNYYTQLDEEKALSYLDTNQLDSYYIDLYKELLGDIESESSNQTVANSIDDIISIIDISLEALDFLSENRNSWIIKDEQIVFNNQSLTDEYNEIISKL